MKPLDELFEEVKDSQDAEQINDFLISIGKAPEPEHLSFIIYFLNSLDSKILEKVKLNLVYVLGELAKKKALDEELILLLVKMYYSSDRWVRNEIIQAFGKIFMIESPPKKAAKVLARALMEEYHPIRISSLKVLSNIAEIPDLALKNIINTIDTQDSEIKKYFSKIIFNHIHTEKDLFDIINNLAIYASMKNKAIRTLIMIYFDTVIPLQSFSNLISDSEWDSEFKERFLKEIDNFSKVLLTL